MKILLIDDHPIFRAGLALLLKEIDPATTVLHAGTCAEGVSLACGEALNLVFLDLNLPDRNGLECLRLLKEARPSLPVVVISGQEIDGATLAQALEMKAMGFVPKSEDTGMIAAALRAALAGGVFLPAGLVSGDRCQPPACIRPGADCRPPTKAQRTPQPCDPACLGITKRQSEVLRMVAQGLPNKRIAANLGISVPVVKKHVSDLLAHFKVVSRTQLVVEIARLGVALGPPGISDPRDEVNAEEV